MSVPVTPGTGASSVAAELVGGLNYQQIEVYGGGGSSVLTVNPDGSLKTSIIGTVTVAPHSVAALQGTNPWVITGSVQATVSTGNSSIMLLNGANTIGSVTTLQGTNPWIITGSVQGSFSGGNSSVQLLAGSAVIGSVAVLQGTNPFIITGSVQATVNTGNSSVMLLNGANTIGSVTTLQGTNPWIITGSVQGSFSPSGNQSVSGTVGASIIGSVPVTFAAVANQSVSGTVGASIIGTVPVTGPITVGTTSIISIMAPKASFISGITSVMTGTGQTSVLVAAGVSIKNYVTHMIVTNGAAVGTFVDIKDGGGNVMYSGYAAANGGGFVANPNPPLVGSANKSVDAQPRAQASIIVAMTGYTDL